MNKSALGEASLPFTMEVERGKIHEFARAVRAAHPAYFTADRPIAPPTFLTTMAFWAELVPGSKLWEKLEIDQKRLLHAEQEYVFHGAPPRAGTKLTCQSKITDIYEKEGRRGGTLTFVVMVTEFRDEAGKLVAEARSTGVETAKKEEAR
jgi:N-terminal half of MaoC dehydratase